MEDQVRSQLEAGLEAEFATLQNKFSIIVRCGASKTPQSRITRMRRALHSTKADRPMTGGLPLWLLGGDSEGCERQAGRRLSDRRVWFSFGNRLSKLRLGHQGSERFDLSEANRDGRAAIPPT